MLDTKYIEFVIIINDESSSLPTDKELTFVKLDSLLLSSQKLSLAGKWQFKNALQRQTLKFYAKIKILST